MVSDALYVYGMYKGEDAISQRVDGMQSSRYRAWSSRLSYRRAELHSLLEHLVELAGQEVEGSVHILHLLL